MNRKPSVSTRIAATYALIGVTWILVSSQVLEALVSDAARLARLQTYSGWVFVLGSALLIGILVDRELLNRRRTEVALRGSRLRERRAQGRVTAAMGEAEHARGEAESARIEVDTAGHRIRRQLERLAAIRSIDAAITGNVDVHGTLNVILEQVTSRLGVDAAAVHLLDSRTRMLTLAASRGFRRHPPAARQSLGMGSAGRVAAERRLHHIADVLQERNGGLSWLVPGESFRGYVGIPLTSRGQVRGVLEVFQRGRLEPDEEWSDFLHALAGQCVIAVEHLSMFDGLQQANLELALAYDRTLEGWSRALELRDFETEGHSRRVTRLTLQLASALGVSEDERVHMRRGALLHDVGKMAIPDSILLKPSALTDEEWRVMRQHPTYAHNLLAPIPFLKPALDIPFCHHESWDGSGYPRGLRGESIPVAARIFTVVDVWDALTHPRPYRGAWSEGMVRDYIRSLSGQHFDPAIARTFLSLDMSAAA
jgi:HD-GYP domain-containing protein (c-di-GMP phosphodiesterase class II)